MLNESQFGLEWCPALHMLLAADGIPGPTHFTHRETEALGGFPKVMQLSLESTSIKGLSRLRL